MNDGVIMKKVILISLDALAATDLPILNQLPNFSRLMREGAWCPAERSVYPSLTFPAHASIVTGCVPGNHGIVNNFTFEPFEPVPHWNHRAGALKRRALWDYAANAGKTVLSLSWPVSAGANIRYSLPEMTPAKPKIWNAATFAAQMQVLFQYGTPSLAARALLLNPALTKAWFMGGHPTLDQGMIKLLKKALSWYNYDIAMLHIYGMDNAKHHGGIACKRAGQFLRMYDKFIGWLLDYTARSEHEITLMITGDHAQRDVQYAIYGNRLLADMGLCEWKSGRLASWKALLDSCDGMAYLYINDTKNRDEITAKVAKRFETHPGVERIMRPDEFRTLGCDPAASLVLEAKAGYGFERGWPAAETDSDAVAPNDYRALHGYLPDPLDYRTLFFCHGRAVNPHQIDSMCITDITPTICDWMGLPADKMDGVPVSGVFQES